MGWKITFTGKHDLDDDSAAASHDFAVRDKARGLFNDLLRLSGGTITKAVVETDTDKTDFIPKEDDGEK